MICDADDIAIRWTDIGILTVNSKKMVVKVLILENSGDGSDGYGSAKRRFNKK